MIGKHNFKSSTHSKFCSYKLLKVTGTRISQQGFNSVVSFSPILILIFVRYPADIRQHTECEFSFRSRSY